MGSERFLFLVFETCKRFCNIRGLIRKNKSATTLFKKQTENLIYQVTDDEVKNISKKKYSCGKLKKIPFKYCIFDQ